MRLCCVAVRPKMLSVIGHRVVIPSVIVVNVVSPFFSVELEIDHVFVTLTHADDMNCKDVRGRKGVTGIIK